MPITPYIRDGIFGPDEIRAMSMALDDVCKALNINGHGTAREVIAMRIVTLAERGERDHTKLRDQLLQEAQGGTGL